MGSGVLVSLLTGFTKTSREDRWMPVIFKDTEVYLPLKKPDVVALVNS